MERVKIILVVILLCSLWSCEDKKTLPDGASFTPSYVQVYMIGSSISGIYMKDCNSIFLDIQGTTVSNQGSPEFGELSSHFNDWGYNKKMASRSNAAIANEFDEIEVISDNDFSEQLPAGSSLASVVKLYSVSPLKFIESGYTAPFDWEKDRPEDFKKGVWTENAGLSSHYGYYPVNKFLSEIVPNDLVLLSPVILFLRFTETPSLKTHKFTITLKEGDEIFSTTVDVIFD